MAEGKKPKTKKISKNKKLENKKFVFLEDIAVADIAFKGFGKNLNELFENSALALFEIMADSKKIRPAREFSIKIESKNVENLLYDFLSELLFKKDTEKALYHKAKVKITKKENVFFLNSKILCQRISAKNLAFFRRDPKAITLHKFFAKEIKGIWTARVIVDI